MLILKPTIKQDLNWYKLILVPLWQNQQKDFLRVGADYRWHLLALECLHHSIGPGGDPLKVAEFCAKWQWPLTMPSFGPTSLIRKIGRSSGLFGEIVAWLKGVYSPGLKSPIFVDWGKRLGPVQALSTAFPIISVFDITGSINIGVKLIAAMSPLISKLQLKQAELIVFDPKVVPPGDMSQVGQIIHSATTPLALLNSVKDCQLNFANAWYELLLNAEIMEQVRLDLGLPPDSM